MKTLKAFVTAPGDASVGVPGHTMTISDIPADYFDDDDGFLRAEARNALILAFNGFTGEHCSVVFSDECPECGNLRLYNDCCVNLSCPLNAKQVEGAET